MKIDILTLFPDSMSQVLGESIIGRAAKKGILDISCLQIRDFTDNKQNQVDDYPYGGGWGCVMMAQPLKACLDHATAQAGDKKRRVIYMSPQGKTFTQEDARRLSEYEHLVLVCGHYEGIDERFIDECVDEEISIGDFVLTGGEIPAMAVTDAVCRLIPGVLSDEECFTGESHWDGLLEYPQYTRPEEWQGRKVPEVLLTGNHKNIGDWRREQQIRRTMTKRPDMFQKLELKDKDDLKLLEKIKQEAEPKKPDISYRLATLDDLDGIMDIITEAQAFLKENGVDQWQDGYPDREDFIPDIESRICWVFFAGEELAGMISVQCAHESDYDTIYDGSWGVDEPYGVIHRSAVASRFRGMGLADEMFELCEDLCMGRGVSHMRIDTHERNIPMLRLLEKRGYIYRGKIFSYGFERVAYDKIFTV